MRGVGFIGNTVVQVKMLKGVFDPDKDPSEPQSRLIRTFMIWDIY